MDNDGAAAELAEQRVQLIAQESAELSPAFVHLGASRGTACAARPGQSFGTPGVAGLPEDQSPTWGQYGGRGSLAPPPRATTGERTRNHPPGRRRPQRPTHRPSRQGLREVRSGGASTRPGGPQGLPVQPQVHPLAPPLPPRQTHRTPCPVPPQGPLCLVIATPLGHRSAGRKTSNCPPGAFATEATNTRQALLTLSAPTEAPSGTCGRFSPGFYPGVS